MMFRDHGQNDCDWLQSSRGRLPRVQTRGTMFNKRPKLRRSDVTIDEVTYQS